MPISVNRAGSSTPVPVREVHVNHAGVLKQAREGWIHDHVSGELRKLFPMYSFPLDGATINDVSQEGIGTEVQAFITFYLRGNGEHTRYNHPNQILVPIDWIDPKEVDSGNSFKIKYELISSTLIGGTVVGPTSYTVININEPGIQFGVIQTLLNQESVASLRILIATNDAAETLLSTTVVNIRALKGELP